MAQSTPLRKVVVAAYHKFRLIYVKPNTMSTAPVEALVLNDGLCGLKIDGNKATTNISDPIDSTISCQLCMRPS